jgi:hypothetical protein
MAKRESREVWAKRVERWGDSGLTAAQYEAETGISARRLSYWKWQLRADAERERKPAAARAPEPTFVEVVAAPVIRKAFAKGPATKGPAAKAEPLDVILGAQELRVRVPVHFDAAALQRLISTLEKR